MASLCPAQLLGDLLKALLQSLFTLFMRCLRRYRGKRAVRSRRRGLAPVSLEAEEREQSSLHGYSIHCGLWMEGQ